MTTFTATRDGITATRTSKTKHYEWAVWVSAGDLFTDDRIARIERTIAEWPAGAARMRQEIDRLNSERNVWGVARWSESLQAAERFAESERRQGWTAEVLAVY